MSRIRIFTASTAIGVVASLAIAHGANANSAPVVSSVSALQIPGTGQVRITYDVADADGDLVTVRLTCSSNGGQTFDLLPVSMTGAVNTPVTPGLNKQIVWDAARDYPGRYWGQVVAKVYATDGVALAGAMVLVPAGSFTMGVTGGQANPSHTVTLDAYYIDKYEVTNAEYQQFIEAGGYTTQAFWSPLGWSWVLNSHTVQPAAWGEVSYRSGPSFPGYPVNFITYYEAEAYAAFAGKRLPTEAEWEKAARGTDGRTYPWGDTLSNSRANYLESGDPYESNANMLTTPVGFFDGRLHPNPVFQTIDSPGPYGTYDQAGNLAEWVKDWFSDTYYGASPASNPQGPVSGAYRVLRGGAWTRDPSLLKSADRQGDWAWAQQIWAGFRCARSVQ